MASQNGRLTRIKMSDDDGATFDLIAGAIEDTADFQMELIDATDKDDAGARTYIDDVGMKFLNLSVSGVMKASNTALEDWHIAAGPGTTLRPMQFVRPDGKTYEGNFGMPAFNIGAADKAGNTFTASFESSGTLTVTST